MRHDLDPLLGGGRREIWYNATRRILWARRNQLTAKNSSNKPFNFLKAVRKVKHKFPEILVFLIVLEAPWCKEYGEPREEAFPGKGHQTSLEEENHRLRRENEILRQEREILKKAISIFTQPHS